MNKFLILLDAVLRPHSKKAFILSLSENDVVLDIGCGNSSDALVKMLAPLTQYRGIDISAQRPEFQGEQYTESSPVRFNADVADQLERADTVISAHNLEHCNDYKELVEIIARTGGLRRAFLSFPSRVSLNLPKSKHGTLNFYQDPTHNTLPDIEFVLSALQEQGWKIDFVARSYMPPIPYLIGFLWSPIFMFTGIESPLYGTYSYYGFESVIWATRK